MWVNAFARRATMAGCLCVVWLQGHATLTTAPDDSFALPSRASPDTNIPGNDVSRREEETPRGCKRWCEREKRCRAWTWVKRGVQGPNAVCFLKSGVSQVVSSSCCVSGYPGSGGDAPHVTATPGPQQVMPPALPPANPQPAPPAATGSGLRKPLATSSGRFECGRLLVEGSNLSTTHSDAGHTRNVPGTFAPTAVRELEDGTGTVLFEGEMTFLHVSPPIRERVHGRWRGERFVLYRQHAGGQRWQGICADHVVTGTWSMPNRPEETGPFLIGR